MAAIKRVSCPDWATFKADLYPTLYGGSWFEDERFIFRGMGDADWHLQSSFDRYASALPAGERAATARRLLECFEDECKTDSAIERCPVGDDDRLAVAQHYGVPTRALDWTHSPYIACHFAFADVRPSGDDTGLIALWALAIDHGAWRDQGVRIVAIDGEGNDRVVRQRGVLTYLEAPYSTLEEHVAACADEDAPALYQFVLPRSEAGTALADLRAMGISSTRLFPDRTGAARAALARCFA